MAVDTELDDGLTDEERSALAEEEGAGGSENEGNGDPESENDEYEGNGAAADAGGESDGAGADAGAADNAGATSEDAGAADGAGSENADPGQPAGTQAESAPLLVAQPPEGATEKLAEIAEQKEALFTKFDDGDITAKEYQAKLDALNKQEREIEWGVEKAKLASEMEAQRQANEWKATVDQFIAENSRYNPETSPRMYKMLDMEVRQVAVSDEFKGRTDSAAGREILKRAHENLAKEFGFEAAPVKQTKQPQTPAKKPELPPSLHSAPAAEANDTNGGKYAVLDRLSSTDPIAYEEALMKLPEAERNAYLAQ